MIELKIKESKRTTLFAELKPFDVFAQENDFIEVTEWTNGEGYDVTIEAVHMAHFQITYGQFRALKKLIKTLNKKPI